MCVCRCKEDKRVPVLTLPRLLSQDTEVRLTTEPLAGPDLAAWQPIERVVKDAVTGQDRCSVQILFTIYSQIFLRGPLCCSVSLQSTCQPLFNNQTSNQLQPRAVVGEPILVKVPTNV